MARRTAELRPVLQEASQEDSTEESTRTSGSRTSESSPTPPLMFPDEDVLFALTYENACNPVLRASARSIIEYIQL
jgi:hypothetical protein